jgi:2-polyprenyl-3-methyl-5-hydroxy-6-metoxy-1,4-benzoquinol methylase
MSKYIFRGEDLSSLIQYRNIDVDECIACRSREFNNFSSSEAFPAVKCINCGLIWMKPFFNKKGLDKYYSEYLRKRRFNSKEKMRQREIQYELDVEFIQNYISKGRMLDVGCSGGFFLSYFNSSFEKHGIEIDSGAVKFSKENYKEFGHNIQCLSIDKYTPSSKFDLIVMRGVIEHVIDPVSEIKKVSELLKSKGLFCIVATPNADAISVDLYRDKWTLFHPIQHLWHFSPHTLSLICSKFNLELIASDFPYLGTPYENAYDDIKAVTNSIKQKENGIDNLPVSPAFFGNMMSLVFRKKS